ncbi:MAG: SulP family inorganic anion transporter [Cyclobacteriaceae bacterium]
MKRILPFLSWWPTVNRGSLKDDLIAGITNAFIVLPQGVAFAIIAGLPPIYGLYTAMVTPIVAALFGSSWHLVSGPTTAISIVIYSSLSPMAEVGTQAYLELALTITLIAGVIQFLLGVARLGSLINFVSHSVIVGFTSGAAILIAFSQMKHVVGYAVPKGPFFESAFQLIVNIENANLAAVLIGGVTLITAILTKKLSSKFPNFLTALLVGGCVSWLIDGASNGVSLVGEIPASLPPLSLSNINLSNVQDLAPKAFAIAMLGLIEAVAIARSIALKSGQLLDGNQEFIGQGLSNIVGSIFSSFAGSGSFGRSGVNYESGAKTPLAAVFAAICLMLIVLLVAPLATYLPMASMGGIILLVAYRLIDFDHIKKIVKSSWQETAVLVITFLSTLIFQLEYAIYLGVLFSLIFYLQRTSQPLIAEVSPDPNHPRRKFTNIKRIELSECPQLKIIRIDGSLYYGAVDHVQQYLKELTDLGVRNVLIIGSGLNIIDVSGAEMLVNEAKRWRGLGGQIYLSSIRIGAREFLQSGGYAEEIGDNNIFETKDEGIKKIYQRLDKSICARCEVRIFKECNAPETTVPLNK